MRSPASRLCVPFVPALERTAHAQHSHWVAHAQITPCLEQTRKIVEIFFLWNQAMVQQALRTML